MLLKEKYIQFKENLIELFSTQTNSSNEIYKRLFLIEKEVIYSNSSEIEYILYGRIPKSLNLTAKLFEFEEEIMDIVNSTFGTKDFNEISKKIYDVKEGISKGTAYDSIDVVDLKNSRVKIEFHPGYIMVIDVWATWCKYCLSPIESCNKIISKYGREVLNTKKVKLMTISCDEKLGNVIDFVKKQGWEMIESYYKKGIREELGVKSLPHIIVVDRNGEIIYNGNPNEVSIHSFLDGVLGSDDNKNDKNDNESLYDPLKPSQNQLNFAEESLKTKQERVKMLLNQIKSGVSEVSSSKLNLFLESKNVFSFSLGKYTYSHSKPVVFGEILENEEEELVKKVEEIAGKVNLNGYIKDFKVDVKKINLFSDDF